MSDRGERARTEDPDKKKKRLYKALFTINPSRDQGWKGGKRGGRGLVTNAGGGDEEAKMLAFNKG